MGAVIPSVVNMTQFNYQHLTKELLESTMNDIFSRNRIASRRRTEEQYWQAVNLAYPSTPDESFKQKSIEIMKGNELDIEITNRSGAYGHSRTCRYIIDGETALRFEQIPFPECCGIAIVKNFSANGDMQKADFLDAMDQFLADIKKNDRYSKVLFYTNAGSNGDKLFSMINGITILDPFRNKRSGNTLVGFEIDLLEKYDTIVLDDEFDEEETDGEQDEDEEEDGLSEEIDEIRRIVEAQAILDGDPQPIAGSSRPESIRSERPTFSNGIMEQIQFGNIGRVPNRTIENNPWYDDRF